SSGGAATLGGGWWTRIGSVVPLVALVAGLMAISMMQEDIRADELAAIDSALLTDDLPPAAYTDPGFAQFLKTSDSASERGSSGNRMRQRQLFRAEALGLGREWPWTVAAWLSASLVAFASAGLAATPAMAQSTKSSAPPQPAAAKSTASKPLWR